MSLTQIFSVAFKRLNIRFCCQYETNIPDKMVTPWGRMKEMKMLVDKTGISEKLSLLELTIDETIYNLARLVHPIFEIVIMRVCQFKNK